MDVAGVQARDSVSARARYDNPATTFFAPIGFDGERRLAEIYCEPLDIPAASVGFVADSLQEQEGFEPVVPPREGAAAVRR